MLRKLHHRQQTGGTVRARGAEINLPLASFLWLVFIVLAHITTIRLLSSLAAVIVLFVLPGYVLLEVAKALGLERHRQWSLVTIPTLSILVVGLSGLVLSVTPFGLHISTLLPMMAGLAALSMGLGVLLRQENLRGISALAVGLLNWRPHISAIASLLASLSLLGIALYGIAVIAEPELIWSSAERFTEFYLQPFPSSEWLPDQVGVDQTVPIAIGLVNRESDPTTYRVVVSVERMGIIDEIEEIIVNPGMSWEGTGLLRFRARCDECMVSFDLFRESDYQPYQSLHLWIDVVEELDK